MKRDELSKRLHDFIMYLEKEKNYSAHTTRAYKKDLESFFMFAEEQNCIEIDHTVITYYIGFLLRYGLDSRTVARKLSSLKSFFKAMKKMGYMDDNPAADVRTPKTKKHLPGFLTYEQVQRGLEVNNTRDKAIMEYSTHVGCGQVKLWVWIWMILTSTAMR